MRRFPLLRSIDLVGALGLAICCSGAVCRAQTVEEEIAQTVAAGHSVVIREHAGWDMMCDPIAHPVLYLNASPLHGRVCARISDVTIRSMYVGTQAQCIGRVVRGVQLVYRPDAGFAGDDRLRYAAQYPSILRPVAVSVTVLPVPPASPGAALSHVGVPVPPTQQAPGPVPLCEDLAF
jgi:hypothetical protein